MDPKCAYCSTSSTISMTSHGDRKPSAELWNEAPPEEGNVGLSQQARDCCSGEILDCRCNKACYCLFALTWRYIMSLSHRLSPFLFLLLAAMSTPSVLNPAEKFAHSAHSAVCGACSSFWTDCRIAVMCLILWRALRLCGSFWIDPRIAVMLLDPLAWVEMCRYQEGFVYSPPMPSRGDSWSVRGWIGA